MAGPRFGTLRGAILGAGVCLSVAGLGCARSQPTTLSQLWEIPPGVPTTIPVETTEEEPPSEPLKEGTVAATPPARKKAWGILPEKMLGPLARNRTPQGDPFLPDYTRQNAAATALADARRNAELQKRAIPLPSGHTLAAIPGMTDAFGNPQDKKNPLAIAGAEHQAGSHANVVGAFNSLDRLRAAIDADKRHRETRTDGAESPSPARSQIDRLMKQARRDYDDGQLAAALRSAQQANALASELKLDFDEPDESPMVLVELIREQLASDVSNVDSLPPEESVASGAKPEPPDFREADGAAEDAAPSDFAGHARLESTITELGAGDEPRTRASSGGAVEDLPPPPDALEPGGSDESDRMEEERQRSLATVVGPFSRLDQTARLFGPSESLPPEAEAERVESSESADPFWPVGEPSDKTAPPDAGSTPTAEGDDVGLSDATPAVVAAPRNVRWRESAQPVARMESREIPQPVKVGIAIAALWITGFVGMRGLEFLRAFRRRAAG